MVCISAITPGVWLGRLGLSGAAATAEFPLPAAAPGVVPADGWGAAAGAGGLMGSGAAPGRPEATLGVADAVAAAGIADAPPGLAYAINADSRMPDSRMEIMTAECLPLFIATTPPDSMPSILKSRTAKVNVAQ